MTPPNIEYWSHDGCNLAYERSGASTTHPVVFLHGLGDSSIITFRQFATHPALDHASTLLIDLPGFGYSTAPDDWEATTEAQATIVAALLDHLGIADAPVVAHSMGGSIAILLASMRPGLVSRLVVAEPLLQPEHSELGTMIAKRKPDHFLARGYAMLTLATQRQAARGDKAARGFQAPLERANPAIMHRSAVSLVEQRSPSFQEHLERLDIPRIILIGERTGIDTSDIERAGVTVVRIPDAGHSMMSENPAGFANAVASALGK